MGLIPGVGQLTSYRVGGGWHQPQHPKHPLTSESATGCQLRSIFRKKETKLGLDTTTQMPHWPLYIPRSTETLVCLQNGRSILLFKPELRDSAPCQAAVLNFPFDKQQQF